MWRLSSFFLLGALCVCGRPPGGGMTADEIVALALARNADLLAARERVAEAQGLLRQAGLRPNPSIEVAYSNGAALNSPGEQEFSVIYSHPIQPGGVRGRRIEAARIGAAVAAAEAAERERQLRAEVRSRYGEALAAARNLATAGELLKITRQSLAIAQARVREGEAPPLEERLLQVEVNGIESDRVLFSNRLEQHLLSLKTLAGMAPDEPLRLGDSLAAPDAPPQLAQVIERALASRADLRTARLQEQLAAAQVAAARAEAAPQLVVGGGYSHVNSRFDQYGFAQPGGPVVPLRDTDNLLTAGVSISLPLRNRNQGNIEAAVARQHAARLRREYLERAAGQEVRAALGRCESARRALEIFERGVIGQSRENLEILRGAYRLGELRLLDVMNAQRRLLETERAYTDLLRDAYLAQVELERAAGAPVK